MVLIVGLVTLCILVIGLLGYILYTRTTSDLIPRSTEAVPQTVVSEDESTETYDFSVLQKMYTTLAADKTFIGDGLYVVLWDKAHHKFYDLYAKNPDTPYNAASVTKLMTALTLAERGALPNEFIADAGMEEINMPEGEVSGDFRGQTFPRQDLLAALLVQSSNQAAYSLVKPMGMDSFLSSMNNVAYKLGMSRSILRDPSGYDFGSKSQASYMSPRDVARVAFELATKYPDITNLSTNFRYDITNTRGKKFTLRNTNPLVENRDDVILSKTGYTYLAGGNLTMVTRPRDNMMVAFVSMHSTKEGRFKDVQNMIQTMETALEMHDLIKK